MPERVRVTHPRTQAARRVAARPVSREIDEHTVLGELYMSSLIRSQRRLAILVCASVAGVLMGVAWLGAVLPRWGSARVFGIPLPWLVLGVAVYPGMIALAAYTVHQAERNERAFTDLVRHR
jgi:hypothetical protein